MADYLTVTCSLPSAAEDHLASALGDWPALGCQVEDVGAGRLAVTIYLTELSSHAVPEVLDGLLALGATELGSGTFAERDWLSEYRRSAIARPVGACFWIDPHPAAPTPPPNGRHHLLVEPRQAFGTGSHESTVLVMTMLEELDLGGRSVLDVGTGSGILALAARALGAGWVVGFDIDVEAIFVASQTVRGQLRPLPVALFAGAIPALAARATFDVVLANLLPAQLEPLLGEIRGLLVAGGRAVVSGLMEDQRTAVETELARHGLVVAAARELGEWVALLCDSR
jgi:ribosomal protein L11 methyltransferase